MNGSMPMKPVAGLCSRLGDEMLAAAEAAFQSDVAGAREQRAQIGRRRAIKIERELRQQRVEQRRLPRLERMALAPAEKRALAVIGMHACVSIKDAMARATRACASCATLNCLPQVG